MTLFEPLNSNKLLGKSVRISFIVFLILNIVHFCFSYLLDSLWPYVYSLLNAISLSILTAYIFYLFVVYIPEKKRRSIMKRGLGRQYQYVKENITSLFLGIVNGTVDSDLTRKLCDIKEFRSYFSENESERWYRILNEIGRNKMLMRDLLVELSILKDEISFVLDNVEIHDNQVYDFLKNAILLIKRSVSKCDQRDPEHHAFNSLMGLVWDVFAGYSFTSGYAERDVFESFLDSL